MAENAALHDQLVVQARDAGVSEERQRLAREIHDTIAQGLAGIVAQLEAATQGPPAEQERHLGLAGRWPARASARPAAPSRPCSPVPWRARGCPEALAAYAKRWSELHGVAARVETVGRPVPLATETEVTLYRVAQEALTNVGRHAGRRTRGHRVLRRRRCGARRRRRRARVRGGGGAGVPRRGSPDGSDRRVRAHDDAAADRGGGGLIQVDSSGEGTVVHVEVPRVAWAGRGALTPIRLMLVDDHPVVRDGLHGVFAADEDFEVVAEAGDGQEALARAARVEVDVVLLDLRMPRMGGVETIRALATQAPDVRVLVLTTFDTDRDVLPAIEAGATGYLLKDASAAELKAAVRAAYAGQPVLAPSVAGRLIGQVAARAGLGAQPTGGRGAPPRRGRHDQPGDRPPAAHQRGHRQDPPAAPLREARRQRPGGRRERGIPARPAVLTTRRTRPQGDRVLVGSGGVRRCEPPRIRP